jgi:hypothetical protein
MDDELDTLLIDVRASTQGFQADIEAMRGAVDTTLGGGFARAGEVLERGLLSAIRRGSLGFDDLKRAALRTMDEIAARALRSGIGSLVSEASGGGAIGQLLSGAIGSLLGLPGRATGGPVAPGQGYLVGERGPPGDAGILILPGTGKGTSRRLVEGHVEVALPPMCPSTMLRMVPLPRWGRI